VAGFANEITVTQEFTTDPGKISAGLEQLKNGGGTRVFDIHLWEVGQVPGSRAVETKISQ
jgi:hypothetical protein